MEITTGASRRWARMLGPLGAESLRFARSLGGRPESSRRLLVVGTPVFEPWHFVAHLDEQATRAGRDDLVPTLLRWSVPPGAPGHLAVPVDALARTARDETVLVVNGGPDAAELLERVADARRHGTRIMAVHRAGDELVDLAHEILTVDPARAARDFELTQHVVTDGAPLLGDAPVERWARGRRLLTAGRR